MVPQPRVHPLLCLVVVCRYYNKAASPGRNWKLAGGARCPRALPPQYPYARRGSNTPISSLAVASMPPAAPNRSRSLDGLLDSGPITAAMNAITSEPTPSPQATQSCDDLDKEYNNLETDDAKVADNSSDVVSIQSNSSDSKRKRNFMDRCVNKVRSLIKK